MFRVTVNAINRKALNGKITDFYISIWHDRLVNPTKYKYSRATAIRNIRDTLSVFSHDFEDTALRKPVINRWKNYGWHEVKYRNWHFAVIVHKNIFGEIIAEVVDCCHDKDYHNDVMQTSPFRMDNPNDMSHLVDWKDRIDRIVTEEIRRYCLNR